MAEISTLSAQPESVIYLSIFLLASQISSITPLVSSQPPGYMCAAAGLLLAGENHRLVQKWGGGDGGDGRGGVAGCPSNRAWATACMHRKRHLLLWCMFCGRQKPGHRPHRTRGGGPRCGTNNALISTPGRDSGWRR